MSAAQTATSDTPTDTKITDVRMAIILVHYRTPQLVVDCLESLATEIDKKKDKVIFVENCSGDGSFEEVEKEIEARNWGSWIHFVLSPFNEGFPNGTNRGIRAVDAEEYLLLNTDTIVRPGALQELRQALAQHPDVGIAAPRMEWPDGKAQASCFRFPTTISEFTRGANTGVFSKLFSRWGVVLEPSEKPFNPPWVCFGCSLIRKEVLEEIGHLDSEMFMYFDDLEFGYRLSQTNWKNLYWPKARVVHLIGQSGEIESAVARRKRRPAYYYGARSRAHAVMKGRTWLWALNIAWSLGRLILLLREVLLRKQPRGVPYEWRDIWTHAWNPFQYSGRP